jgi:hypothetical protein
LRTTRDEQRGADPIFTDAHIPGTEGLFDFDALGSWFASPRDTAERALDMYETLVDKLIDANLKAARAFDVPAITAIAETQAAILREATDAYVTSARKLFEQF